MRKLYRTIAATIALCAALALAPTRANAVGYEDSLEDCAYPESFDAFIMRPLAFTGLMFGGLTLVVGAPIWAAFDARDAGTITHNLVVEPARFAFGRRIGECATNASNY
ncbi:MAG TPA: hypothetical protein VEI82_12160 [Myxococcota bacterium]|nr:hypothetical protein [Myxococcota bacterium]